jgi:DNA mismatch repair protein MutL
MSALAPIRRLSPDTVARIAAGEVIERPASVVKELVENSLDAGARQVSIEIGRGGIDFIRVSDDGYGIAAAELPLAFERYATSKLPDDADLEEIATLGFRGEALPSVAAVAEVEIASRSAMADAGAVVRVEEGRVLSSAAAGTPPGTIVTARRLFQRQPARLKFLRSPQSEAGQVATLAGHYALAYPEVRFSLLTDGRRTLGTPGNGRLIEAAAGVYGHQVAEQLLSLEGEEASGQPEDVGLRGLLSPPGLSRSTRGYISLFINRRWVRNRPLTFAVEEAYRGVLMTGRYPIAVIDLRLPPSEIDVNVHPAKTEVRLRREREVFAALQRQVRRTLSTYSPVPDVSASVWAPSGLGQTPSGDSATVGQRRLAGAEKSLESGPPDAAEQPALVRQLPVLRALGQVGWTYVAAEGPEGLYLVDQHAAHERILFERFLGGRGPSSERQAFLDPMPIELSPRHRALISNLSEALAEQGFDIEPFGEGTWLLRAVPAALGDKDIAQQVLRFLDTLDGEEKATDDRERVAMSLACHSAVRAGQPLSAEEMRELLRQLEETQSPRTCPHGRPTMIHLSAEALAREFRRR